MLGKRTSESTTRQKNIETIDLQMSNFQRQINLLNLRKEEIEKEIEQFKSKISELEHKRAMLEIDFRELTRDSTVTKSRKLTMSPTDPEYVIFLMEKYNELLQCMNSFPIIRKYGPGYEMTIYRSGTLRLGSDGYGIDEKYTIGDLYKKRAAKILYVLLGVLSSTELFHFQDFFEKKDIQDRNVRYSDDIIDFIYKVMKISFELHSQDFELPRPTKLSRQDIRQLLEYKWNIPIGFGGEDTVDFKLFEKDPFQIMIEQRRKINKHLPKPDWGRVISTFIH